MCNEGIFWLTLVFLIVGCNITETVIESNAKYKQSHLQLEQLELIKAATLSNIQCAAALNSLKEDNNNNNQ